MNTSSLLMIMSVVFLSACSDNGSSNQTLDLTGPDDDVTEQTGVLLTQLIDEIFLASENSEPVKINDLEIIDNADEFSFSYLTGE
ncbi:hypothetical protein [Thalassolituus sp.]|uniref:hypothetical protein n=1 Tax=Thalassolituus sp. TaxID=2030822 RepID=UPI0035146393